MRPWVMTIMRVGEQNVAAIASIVEAVQIIVRNNCLKNSQSA
jgi:hypothetical protein